MRYLIFLPFLGLMACGQVMQVETPQSGRVFDREVEGPPPPPPTARTVEQFDTTNAAEREAASATSSGGTSLGETVASLGDAATPGFWVQTPLVSEIGAGRVVNTANGKSVEVELRPIPGGSARVSLPTLRLLEAPLTDLVTLEVFALSSGG